MPSKNPGPKAATPVVSRISELEALDPDEPVPYSLTPLARAVLALADLGPEAGP